GVSAGGQAARYTLPIMLEQGRMAGAVGTHYILDAGRAAAATALHGVLLGGMEVGVASVAGLARVRLSEALNLNRMMLAVPQPRLELIVDDSLEPNKCTDSVDIYLPEEDPVCR